MPRSLQQIIDQADELSVRFETHDSDRSEIQDTAALRAVQATFKARAEIEATLAESVSQARAEGHSWAAVGAMLGTSGEPARSATARQPASASRHGSVLRRV